MIQVKLYYTEYDIICYTPEGMLDGIWSNVTQFNKKVIVIVITSNYSENILTKEMNNEERNIALQFLLHELKYGKLSYGAMDAVAIKIFLRCRNDIPFMEVGRNKKQMVLKFSI